MSVPAEQLAAQNLVRVEQRAAVRWLTLNRPRRRNALDPNLVAALDAAIADAMSDDRTAVVVIAGAGPSFCAGADLRHLLSIVLSDGDPRPFLTAVSGCFSRLERSAKPVIAAVHGHVVAGGMELALASDLVIACTGTVIGDSHVRHGLLPGGGASVRLPRKLGEPLARRLMLTGELLPAEAFLACGFIHSVVQEEQFHRTVTEIAEQLAAAGTSAAERIKQLFVRGPGPSADAALAREIDVFTEHWHDSDIAGPLHRFIAGKRD